MEYGGSVSGAHGDGLIRTWFLRRQYGRLVNVFTEIKNVFDPGNMLNPGKIVGHSRSGLLGDVRRVDLAASMKPIAATESSDLGNSELPSNGISEPASLDAGALETGAATSDSGSPVQADSRQKATLSILQPNLNWDLKQIALTARNCNGCGRCRTQAANERMCPIFRLSPREEASPRAKANLMRGVLTGQLDPKIVNQDDFKEIVDLCVNCHQCRLECPAGVDIPKLMVEAKAQYYSVNSLKISDWLLTHLDWLCGIAGQTPRITNFMLRDRTMRWVLDRILGIAEGRKLPLFDRQTFARWSQRHKLHRPSKQQSRKVVFFTDAYVSWNDCELGIALVKILKHNGIDVFVPGGQNISGMSLISEGSLTRAKRLASRNVEMLAEWVRQGYQVITTEPSAALALKHEYLNLLDDPDAMLVAANTTDASNYLLELHRTGDLELDFKPINSAIGYHLPCHQRALGKEIPALELLRLIPGAQVELIDKGCSGMAGIYGLKRKNYVRSLRMGFALINAMRSPDIVAGSTECSACKIQMEQGTTKPTIHPIKIMAMAYGLMPELDDLFTRLSGELVVS
jgi:anaerobic glycerol-3-phosphate dehydrogenase C subunit